MEEFAEENAPGGNKKKQQYLLEMVDSMTMKPMSVPAISPFGHVLDYTTWLRLLKETPRNTCPFTKQRLTRRDLVKLTEENIEEHRSHIIVVNLEACQHLQESAEHSVQSEQDGASSEEEESGGGKKKARVSL